MSLIPLKIEFHSHTNLDPTDSISYNAYDLIDQAALQGFDALAITCHDFLQWSKKLVRYSQTVGILLIPGLEATIEGKHVLVYGPKSFVETRTFDQLRELRASDPNILTIAPHPYFPSNTCLGRKLLENLDCFDAIEYSHFYTKRLNFNRQAETFARLHNKTLVGTSDVHLLNYQLGKTYTLVHTNEKSYRAIVTSVRKGLVTIETQALSPPELAGIFFRMIRVGMVGRLNKLGLLPEGTPRIYHTD